MLGTVSRCLGSTLIWQKWIILFGAQKMDEKIKDIKDNVRADTEFRAEAQQT